jgi:hypothetical protein
VRLSSTFEINTAMRPTAGVWPILFDGTRRSLLAPWLLACSLHDDVPPSAIPIAKIPSTKLQFLKQIQSSKFKTVSVIGTLVF